MVKGFISCGVKDNRALSAVISLWRISIVELSSLSKHISLSLLFILCLLFLISAFSCARQGDISCPYTWLSIYIIFRISDIFIYLPYIKLCIISQRYGLDWLFDSCCVLTLYSSSDLAPQCLEKLCLVPLQIHSSAYFFQCCLFLVMSGQKAKRRKSGFSLPRAAQMPGQREAKFDINTKHLDFSLNTAAERKDHCFTTFNTKSAHFRVLLYCLWPLVERSHVLHIHFSVGLNDIS